MASSGNGAPPLSPVSSAKQHQRPRDSYLGCSRITDYELLGKLGEGTFGEVHKARSKKTGSLVALKKIIMHNEKDGFPITALREIKLLKLLSHRNVLSLEDMAVEHHTKASKLEPFAPPGTPSDELTSSSADKRKRPIMYMVTPYMDHDLSGLLDNPSVTFTVPQIKCYMKQLLQGLQYLHESHILHRDMKAANLLINNKGVLQIADFGLARHYDGNTPQPAIDLWGVGCVFGEMLYGKPILAGESDTHQLVIIFDLVGSPTEQTMPGWKQLPGGQNLQPPPTPGNLPQRFRQHGPLAISLLKELLKLDWRARINAVDALQHPYFTTAPLPAQPGDIPTYEDSHELDRRKYTDRKAALPPAPKGGAVGDGGFHGNTQGFSSGDGYGPPGGRANGGRHPTAQNGGHRNGPSESRRPAWARDRDHPPLIPACRPGRHHQRMAIPAIAIESTVIGRLVLLTDEALQSADQMSTRIFPATEWEEEMRGHPETTVLREMIDDDGTTTMIDGRQIGTVSETA
ncbi:kinase-like domain-containing protein [Apiospora kogelbergensis]|uniref:kinase-like domain-containing protein n=1 Tax=Apiospora kogelbergensis TaxID=1337665 RepID=UPI003131E423